MYWRDKFKTIIICSFIIDIITVSEEEQWDHFGQETQHTENP